MRDVRLSNRIVHHVVPGQEKARVSISCYAGRGLLRSLINWLALQATHTDLRL